jgi:hypothetical protein
LDEQILRFAQDDIGALLGHALQPDRLRAARGPSER